MTRRSSRPSVAAGVAAAVRQRRFPRPLRIGAADLPDGIDALVDAVRALGEAAPTGATAAGPDDGVAGDGAADDGDVLDDRSLAGLATALWRTRRRMLQPGTDEPLPELRHAFRHLQSTWQTLAAAGVTIQDHDGTPFESGLALEVLTFQPTAGLRAEQVVETVRPSVYVRTRTIQLGQVIVGTPDGDDADDADDEGGGR